MPLTKEHRMILDDITGKRDIKKIQGREMQSLVKAPLGKAYCFHYPNPKTKNTLDYWMEFPVIVILARSGNRILALNLQHLTFTYSLNLAHWISRKIANKKRSIRYEEIKVAIQKCQIPRAMLAFAIRSYLLDRISGRVYVLEMSEYYNALKDLPRKTKKMGLRAAIKSNMAKYHEYVRNYKKLNK